MAFQPIDLLKAVITGEAAVKGLTKAVSLLYGEEIGRLFDSLKAAGAQGTPTNHDLERGIRLAQISASLVVVIAHARQDEEHRRDARGLRPDPFVAPALAFLRGQAGLCATLATIPNDELAALLETGLNTALSEAGRGPESDLIRTHRRIAEREAWSELAAGVAGIPPSEELRRRFFGEMAEEPGWFACFIAFFRESLKSNPKIRVPFFVSRIAEILTQGRAMLTLLNRMRGEMADGFDRVQSETERRHIETMATLATMVEVFAREKGVPIPPLAAVLRRLGEPDVASDDIPARLEAAAERLLILEAQLSQPSNDRPETKAARDHARQLLDAGDLDGAEAALRGARGALRERRERTAREEAGLLRDEAGIAQLRLDYAAEAMLHEEAAELLDFDREAAWTEWLSVADALHRRGREFGENAALRRALNLFEVEVLPRAPRADQPINWAKTQNELGNVLLTLGRRSDNAALAGAVAAYESALLEYTREHAQIDWAEIQNNLGNALLVLGRRGDDQALLNAVGAYENALLERTREGTPAAWATTQNNLGDAFQNLEKRGHAGALAKAFKAYENALLERTRKRAPRQWAMTQNNLGDAFLTLGKRGDDTALARAISAYESALLERTRNRAPLAWAMTQNNLGNALRTLGGRGDGHALLGAITAYDNALLERTRERTPLQWAMTQENMALAEMMLADLHGEVDFLRSALARLEGALEEYRPRSSYNTAKAEELANSLRERLSLCG